MFLSEADPVLYFLGASSLIKYALMSFWNGRPPKDAEYVGTVTELRLHPLKSGRYIAVDQIECKHSGLYNGIIGDRQWMVVETDGTFVTGKTEPRLAAIIPSFHGNGLHLDAAGSETLTIDITKVDTAAKKTKTHIHGVTSQGLDCGEEAARWLDAYINKPGRSYRLLYSPAWLDRRTVIAGTKKYLQWTKTAKEVDKIAFADNVHALVISQESMADLNGRLSSDVSLDQFRPNIVTRGGPAYDEDTWKVMYIGKVKLTAIKLCGRCVFVNVDPETGTSSPSQQPLELLRSYRLIVPDYGQSPCLGINLVTDWEGTIKVGDSIYVTRGDSTQVPQ